MNCSIHQRKIRLIQIIINQAPFPREHTQIEIKYIKSLISLFWDNTTFIYSVASSVTNLLYFHLVFQEK